MGMLFSVISRSKVMPWFRARSAFHSRSRAAWGAARKAPTGFAITVSRRRGSPWP